MGQKSSKSGQVELIGARRLTEEAASSNNIADLFLDAPAGFGDNDTVVTVKPTKDSENPEETASTKSDGQPTQPDVSSKSLSKQDAEAEKLEQEDTVAELLEPRRNSYMAGMAASSSSLTSQGEARSRHQNFFADGDLDSSFATDSLATSRTSLSSTGRKKVVRRYSRVRRLITPKVNMKIVPEELLDDENTVYTFQDEEVRTPSGLFEVVLMDPKDKIDSNVPGCSSQLLLTLKKELQLDEHIAPQSYMSLEEVEDEHVSANQLYNSLVDASEQLIIDTRTLDQFVSNHIIGAVHYYELKDKYAEDETLSSLKVIILYDDSGLSFSLRDSTLSRLMEAILERKGEAFILQGGFQEFMNQHPYMCCPQDWLVSHIEEIRYLNNFPSIVGNGQIFLGRADQSMKRTVLDDLKITHIVRLSHDSQLQQKDITYLHVPISDVKTYSIFAELPKVINFISQALSEGESSRILVHCNLGVSRSSTFLIAYFMYKYHWTLGSTYKYLKEQRPVIRPNTGFIRQLSMFEKIMYGKRLTNLAQFYSKEEATSDKNVSEKDAQVEENIVEEKEMEEINSATKSLVVTNHAQACDNEAVEHDDDTIEKLSNINTGVPVIQVKSESKVLDTTTDDTETIDVGKEIKMEEMNRSPKDNSMDKRSGDKRFLLNDNNDVTDDDDCDTIIAVL